MNQLARKATLAPYQDYYEPQYLLRLYELYCSVDKAAAKEDRTGVGRYSKFGGYLKHNTGIYGPALLHTKQVHLKSVIAELCWFLRGDTNVKWLQEQGCRIWNQWIRPDGDLGPIYPWQWRNAGPYDQIARMIQTIIDKPSDSGNLVCSWSVNDINEMALRPCHTLWQVCVENGVLDLMLYQRCN